MKRVTVLCVLMVALAGCTLPSGDVVRSVGDVHLVAADATSQMYRQTVAQGCRDMGTYTAGHLVTASDMEQMCAYVASEAMRRGYMSMAIHSDNFYRAAHGTGCSGLVYMSLGHAEYLKAQRDALAQCGILWQMHEAGEVIYPVGMQTF